MLIRLYSDTKLFSKEYTFHPGINMILGKYSGDRDEKGINGIGKSSLVRIIDYALLSNSAAARFSQPKYNFLREEKHSIILDFAIQGKNYTIKRSFNEEDIIHFGESQNPLMEYTRSEMKSVLSNIFFPITSEESYFVGERYGTLMDFYIKDDLNNIKRFEPLNFSSGTTKQASKAIFNFFLMGLPTRHILKYDEVSKEYEEFGKTVSGLENKIKIDSGRTIEEFKSDRIKMEQSISVLEKSLKDFTFLENYKKIEAQLIELTGSINDKLREHDSLSRRLKKLRDNFHLSNEVDLKQIEKLYNEVSKTFGQIVTKSLADIANFKREIIENRNKFLISKETQLQKAIKTVLDEISKYEISRSELYKKLEEKGALESITNTYEQLTIEKTSLAANLNVLSQIDELQEMMSNLNVSISEIKRDILLDIKRYENLINEFRALFLEVLKNAIYLEEDNPSGYIDISVQPKSSRKQLPFKIEVDIPKADALGQSRLKIVVYDLVVFLKSIRDSRLLPDFIIHDGVYHGIAINTRVKALNYLYHQNLIYPNFQYFVTFNEDEIYIPDEKKEIIGSFDFTLDEKVIIATFSDTPSEMLFQRDFK